MPTDSATWLDLVTALSTAAAAFAAAFSARTSHQSAVAAKDAVNEARLSRQLELEPKIVLEKAFFNLTFIWNRDSAADQQAGYLAKPAWNSDLLVTPTFTLENFGQTPAFDVSIEWRLDVPNDFKLSEQAQQQGLTVKPHVQAGPGFGPKSVLTFHGRYGGSGAPLYIMWTTDIPNASPNQRRIVEFPREILNAVFAKSLEHGSTVQEIVLVANIQYRSALGSNDVTQFRWKLIPFWHFEIEPVRSYSHVFELPMYPKVVEASVA